MVAERVNAARQGRHGVGGAVAKIPVVLNRHADEAGDGVLDFLGEFGGGGFFIITEETEIAFSVSVLFPWSLQVAANGAVSRPDGNTGHSCEIVQVLSWLYAFIAAAVLVVLTPKSF